MRIHEAQSIALYYLLEVVIPLVQDDAEREALAQVRDIVKPILEPAIRRQKRGDGPNPPKLKQHSSAVLPTQEEIDETLPF